MAVEKNNTSKRHHDVPRWEWVIAVFGMALLAGVVGFTAYKAIVKDPRPPELVFNVKSLSAANGGYRVIFTISNKGDETAAGVHVEGILKTGDQIVEKSTVRIAYAPADSERSGALLFARDPAAHQLEIRATGYEEP